MNKFNSTFKKTMVAAVCIALALQVSAQTKPSQPVVQPDKSNQPRAVQAVKMQPNRADLQHENISMPDGRPVQSGYKNDPMNTHFYKLPNGLNVWITVNKNEPRLQTMIAVKAGSKNDPASHTGLAHYLEHMLFKGTDKFGSKDFSKEEPLLTQIEKLYEIYGAEKDDMKRKAIYHAIDSVSGEAAKFAIANEYDKMLSNIGAKGTNAFTSTDMTVYINDIPANQMEKWLAIESERFRNPQLRLFHTELEAVYEEKNRTLDNDGRKVEEALMSSLFKHHSYGTQTTIGTIEHLKAPSIVEIKKYFHANYVPNNMAIILSGDIDPDATFALITKMFGYMAPKPVEPYRFAPEEVKTAPEVKTVFGPEGEEVDIAYRMSGCNTADYYMQQMISYMMSNSDAGLLDLNLVKQQKVLDASSGLDENSDYNVFELSAQPREGQSLEECKDLLLGQIDLLKKGTFDESLLTAIVANMKVEEIKRLESNSGRAFTLENIFVHNINYEAYVNRFDVMSKITKQQIMDFANRTFTNDCAICYKKTGDDKDVKKVEKPAITPVSLNRVDQSDFLKGIYGMKVNPIAPEFVNFETAISKDKMTNGNPIWYVKNTDNQLFNLYYVFDMGSLNDKKLVEAINYLQYIGTDKYTAEQISKEFYKLACRFGVSVANDQVYVSLNGLQENFKPAVDLFESLLNSCVANDDALQKMVAGEIKSREDDMKNRGLIRSRLTSYATYGSISPSTYVLTNTELKTMKAAELVDKLKSLKNYEHRIYYVGPTDMADIKTVLQSAHAMAAKPMPVPPAFVPTRLETATNKVLFVDYEMKQVEIIWVNKSGNWDVAEVPTIRMFNEYFGGSMSGVVFQNIRESKALAYSTFASYSTPQKKEDPFYITAYVGAQADKLNQAIPAMNELFNDMPKSEKAFSEAKEAIKNKIESERIRKTNILFTYQNALKLGIQTDVRQSVYENLSKLQFADIEKFEQKNMKNKAFTYCVLASSKKVSTTDLAKYGAVTTLKLDELFGY